MSSAGFNNVGIENEIQQYFENLQEQVSEYLVTNLDEPMEKVVVKLLVMRNKTVCTAESCTGGFISHLLTTISGSSQFYDASVVSYSYKAKEDLLAVSKETLELKGAVSEEVVVEMARGALASIQSDYVIAVSGIMGPDGGLPDKPVGTVWIAVGNKNNIQAQKLHFRFDRERNTHLTATNALNFLRKFILADV